jgi:hypothetical protein
MRIILSFANTMTPARQQRKSYRVCGAAIAGLLLALSTGLPLIHAATTERIVVDWHTGLAIGGYDPVAFFTDGKPMAGRPDFELRYGGAVWRAPGLLAAVRKVAQFKTPGERGGVVYHRLARRRIAESRGL